MFNSFLLIVLHTEISKKGKFLVFSFWSFLFLSMRDRHVDFIYHYLIKKHDFFEDFLRKRVNVVSLLNDYNKKENDYVHINNYYYYSVGVKL